MSRRNLIFIIISAILLIGCKNGKLSESKLNSEVNKEQGILDNMKLTSPAFEHNQLIPKRHTCDGEDLSPHLRFEDLPMQTKSLALIVDDPDAPGKSWVHWLVWNIPPQFQDVPEGSPPPSALQGTNDFGNQSYGGPCPPPGPDHRYFFKLYALDNLLEIEKGATKPSLGKAMEGHILAQTELIGLYGRGR